MCHTVIGEEYFVKQVKQFQKRLIRSRTNARSYHRNVKQAEWLARNSHLFGMSLIVDETKKELKVLKVKQEEEEEQEETESEKKVGVRAEKFNKGIAWSVSYLKGATLGGAA
jgi:hypothetical protein